MPIKRPLSEAARYADWGQVICNGGPPCFRLEGVRFCLRTERWEGHSTDHQFISLEEFLDSERDRIAAVLDENVASFYSRKEYKRVKELLLCH
jgi:hypothetical protein